MRCIWRRTFALGLVVVLGFGLEGLARAGEPPVLQICVGDEESYPWHFPDRPGVLIHMMSRVENRVGGKFVIEAKPWKRCLLELKSGLVQAVFKASYSEERAAEGLAFPMRGGQLDISKRMMTESYSLFRLKDARVEWDGKQLSADGILGAQTGFSVVALLRGLGAKVDDGNRQTAANFQKLLMGRVVAVAVQTQVGDAQLAQNPKWAARVERMQPVLIEKPYFLIFSRSFFAEQEDHARLIWSTIEQVRESTEYKELLLNFK